MIRTSFGKYYNDVEKFKKPYHLRHKALVNLAASSNIETNFISKHQFYFAETTTNKEALQKQFYQNLYDCPYGLCVRGIGNFSFRLFEIMAMGRIPVFVNTDCNLPFPDKIQWKKNMVWIEEYEVKSIVEKVIEFHNKLNPQSFLQLQKDNRKIWEDYLSFSGYFNTMLNNSFDTL